MAANDLVGQIRNLRSIGADGLLGLAHGELNGPGLEPALLEPLDVRRHAGRVARGPVRQVDDGHWFLRRRFSRFSEIAEVVTHNLSQERSTMRTWKPPR